MVWTFLGLLVRSAFVLLAANLLRRLPRNTSPAHRHAVLLTGFLLLLVWPLLPLFVPEVYVPLAFRSPLHGSVTVQQTVRTTSTAGHLPAAVLLTLGAWTLGVLCVLFPLVRGYGKVLLLQRRGTCVGKSWHALINDLVARSGLPRTPAIYIVPDYVVPQTFGVFRPVILLPQECSSWSESKLRAVLLHEFAHIKRHDTCWLLLINVAVACWWFQPLCWVARRWAREESELACDAAVLTCGIQPSAYATELLAIAKAYQTRAYESLSALPMAATGSLELRVRSVLSPLPSGAQRQSTPQAIFFLFLLTAVCSGVSIAANGRLISEGGVSMRRTVFSTLSSGLLTSASLAAATIGGSVLDPSGAAVTNAKASLYNPDTKARQETVSVADGKFGFDHLEAGQYILRVDKPGFAPILRAFNVQQDSTVDRGLTLHSGSDADPHTIGSNATSSSGSRVVRVGGQVAESNLTEKVQPVYPATAKSAGIQGTVELEAIISTDGVPEDIRVVSSPSDDLSQSALEAVRQWRYRPTLLNGSPVAILTAVVVNYTLAP